MGEKARLNRKVCGIERSHETACADGIERHLESLGPTDRPRELRLMQSRDEPSGEEGRAGTGCAEKVEFARPGFLRERTESRGLSLLSENGGDEPDARCQGGRPRPGRPLGRAGVVGIHDERDRLQRAFGRAELGGHVALLAAMRLRDVLRRTSRPDAPERDLGR